MQEIERRAEELETRFREHLSRQSQDAPEIVWVDDEEDARRRIWAAIRQKEAQAEQLRRQHRRLFGTEPEAPRLPQPHSDPTVRFAMVSSLLTHVLHLEIAEMEKALNAAALCGYSPQIGLIRMQEAQRLFHDRLNGWLPAHIYNLLRILGCGAEAFAWIGGTTAARTSITAKARPALSREAEGRTEGPKTLRHLLREEIIKATAEISHVGGLLAPVPDLLALRNRVTNALERQTARSGKQRREADCEAAAGRPVVGEWQPSAETARWEDREWLNSLVKGVSGRQERQYLELWLSDPDVSEPQGGNSAAATKLGWRPSHLRTVKERAIATLRRLSASGK